MKESTKSKQGILKRSNHSVDFYWKKTKLGETLVIEIPYGHMNEESRKLHEEAHIK